MIHLALPLAVLAALLAPAGAIARTKAPPTPKLRRVAVPLVGGMEALTPSGTWLSGVHVEADGRANQPDDYDHIAKLDRAGKVQVLGLETGLGRGFDGSLLSMLGTRDGGAWIGFSSDAPGGRLVHLSAAGRATTRYFVPSTDTTGSNFVPLAVEPGGALLAGEVRGDEKADGGYIQTQSLLRLAPDGRVSRKPLQHPALATQTFFGLGSARASDGALWYTSDESAIVRYRNGKERVMGVSNVPHMVPAASGAMWMADGTLARVSPSGGEKFVCGHGIVRVDSVARDGKGRLWFTYRPAPYRADRLAYLDSHLGLRVLSLPQSKLLVQAQAFPGPGGAVWVRGGDRTSTYLYRVVRIPRTRPICRGLRTRPGRP